MNKFVKSLLALGITSALSVSLISQVNAATYKIVDQGEVSEAKYTYAQQQNSSGDMAISAVNLYDFPVQFDYLDDDDFDAIENYVSGYLPNGLRRYESVHGLNDIEDSSSLRAGNPTANDLSWVIRWLQDGSSGTAKNSEYQKVGDTISIVKVNSTNTNIGVWDVKFDGTDTLTRSTVDIVSGITDGGKIYGAATAPYLPVETVDVSDDTEYVYWLRDHGRRGFYSDSLGSEIFEITPFETKYVGGTSALTDVNDADTAVGFSSYKVLEKFEESLNKANTGCVDEDIVANSVIYAACVAEKEMSFGSAMYHNMAFKTTLSPEGNPVLEQLGLLVTPHEDDERLYSSYALAVNNQGVAVGYADGFDDETVTNPAVDQRRNFHYAVAFKNGDVIDLSGEHDTNEYGASSAYDINDAGLAVGHIFKIIEGSYVAKFFYADTNVEASQIEMITPDDFFHSSDSTARAINNNGLIVGEGEVETHNESPSNPRRTAAFVYSINDKTFSNLNELIACDLRNTYNILEARGINDDGMISATAVIKVERRDAKGELMLDSTGSPLTEDVFRAISLEPIPDDGEVCTAEQEGKVERQGASISLNSIWLFMALIGLRRKFFNK